MIQILKNSTGYKRLDVYVLMNVIQLETLVFCRRYLSCKNDDPCGRQFDQMTQAARSGVKNLTEGSERAATSARDVLTLLDVAKASLCELRDDYMTWLLDRRLPPWRISSEEAQAVYRVLVDKADYGDDVNYDVACHIIATRDKFRPWFGADGPRQPSTALETDGTRRPPTAFETDSSRRPTTAVAPTTFDGSRRQSVGDPGVRFANAMLILIGRSLHMLGKLMEQQGETFRQEGGFSERLTAARVEEKRRQKEPVAEDAPCCPLCGSPMRLRHGAKGAFWGCTAYPTCRGTRPFDGSRQQSIRRPATAVDSNRFDGPRQQSTAVDTAGQDRASHTP